MVIPREERVDLVEPHLVQVRDLADGRPVIRMIGRKQRRDNRHRAEAVRPVLVVLPPLVEDDRPLVRELGFGQGRQQVPHPVRFHPQPELEPDGGKDFPVVRPIRVGRSIDRGAGALERLKVAVIVVRRPFKHQVLEEMSEARVSGPLVLGADVIPDVDGDDRAVVILVEEHVEAVRERMPREGEVHRKLIEPRSAESWAWSSSQWRPGPLRVQQPERRRAPQANRDRR